MKIRAVLRRMLRMSEPAWYIFLRSLQLSCLMLFCAFLLSLEPGGLVRGFAQRMTALALFEAPQGILLLGLLLSVFLEDAYTRRS